MPHSLDLGHHSLFRESDLLFRWVHPEHLHDQRILPAHCPTSQWREGLSCDWSVLASPDETAVRKGRRLPVAVLSVTVGECLQLGLDVRHCPVLESTADYNLAHCLLIPPSSTKSAIARLRESLLQRARVRIVRPSVLRTLSKTVRRLSRRRAAALRLIRQAVSG